MHGESISKTETTGERQRIEANVTVGVNADGTYTVSVGVPQIKGKTTGSQSSSLQRAMHAEGRQKSDDAADRNDG